MAKPMNPLKTLLLALLVLSPLISLSAEDVGHIQIKCEPQVQIFLNGEFKGVTNAEVGGLILPNVHVGQHTIKAVKQGFKPQETEINLAKDQVLPHTVNPFIPKVEIQEKGEETGAGMEAKLGTVVIKSLPVECIVDITDLGITKQKKTRPEMEMKNVLEGTHLATFQAMGKTLRYQVQVLAGQTTRLMVNFIDGKVVDLSAEERREAEQARKQAEQARKQAEQARKQAEQARKQAEQAQVEGMRRKRVESGLYFTGWPFDETEAKRRQKLTAEKLGISIQRDEDLGNGVKMTLVLIPAGEFMMGSPDSESGREDNEGPVHKVSITKPFHVGKFEVTQAQWQAVMGNNPSKFKGDQNPVEQVSWDDCQQFVEKLSKLKGKRFALPTEAQWEYACRAGSEKRFCFGDSEDSLGDHAWYDSNSGSATHPVGQKKPNAWGLFDVQGNVFEWCQDYFHRDFYQKCPEFDPVDLTQSEKRVLRGGAWCYLPLRCRAAYRYWGAAVPRDREVGFRLVLDLE